MLSIHSRRRRSLVDGLVNPSGPSLCVCLSTNFSYLCGIPPTQIKGTPQTTSVYVVGNEAMYLLLTAYVLECQSMVQVVGTLTHKVREVDRLRQEKTAGVGWFRREEWKRKD